MDRRTCDEFLLLCTVTHNDHIIQQLGIFFKHYPDGLACRGLHRDGLVADIRDSQTGTLCNRQREGAIGCRQRTIALRTHFNDARPDNRLVAGINDDALHLYGVACLLHSLCRMHTCIWHSCCAEQPTRTKG